MVDVLNRPAPSSEHKVTGSIAHATEILICLSNDIHTVSDIARACRFSKTTVHRVLKLLEDSSLVVEDTINRNYYLGPLVRRLASNPTTTHKRLITCSMDEMKRLSYQTEETVAMDILSGINYYSLHEIPSRHDLRVTQESKKIGPLYAGIYAGATVKTLLSQLDEMRLKVFLDSISIVPETERTVTDKELLIAQLKDIRLKGYAVSYGERVPGTTCVAVPIKNYFLPVVLCVVGPESRLQPRVKDVLALLKASSTRISSSISSIFRSSVNSPI
jgi:DNA-binding IclR family transcriptional regulator